MEAELKELCAEAMELEDGASRSAFLRRYPQLLDTRVVEELAEAVRTAVRVDIPQAARLADAAVAIAGQLGHDEAMGRALRAKANASWFMGDCKSAVNLFQRAAFFFERAGNLNEVARTLSGSIQSNSLLGDYEAAFRAADRAREIFNNLGETWRVARLSINVANIYHRQNRYAEALSAYEGAYRDLLPHKDMEGVGVALHNMAVCLIALDDFGGAMGLYRRVREVCEQQQMPLLVAQADYNIAYLYYLRGEYTKALELLRATRETCRKNGDSYHLGLCDLDRSEIYLELNLIEEAAEMAQISLDHFRQLGMNYEACRSQMNLAIAVSLQGDAKRALELFAGAKEMARKEDNQVLPSLIDLYGALVLFDCSEFTQAEELCRDALNFFRSAPLPSKHVLCRLLLTRILLRAGDSAGSTRECEAALNILEKLDAPILLYQAHFLRGQILESSGEPEMAYVRYQEARSGLETLRSSLQRDELKIGFMRNRLEIYDRLVQLCLHRDSSEASAEEALWYIEAAKSRTLQDLILAGAQSNRSETGEHETDVRVHSLRKELNWFYHCIEREQYSAEGASENRLEALNRQATACEHQLLRLLLEAPVSATVGAALRSSQTATLDEIRAALGAEATLVEYFAMEGRIHAAVVSAKNFKILPIAGASQVTQRLRMLQFQLSKFRLDRTYVERFETALLNATQMHLQALYNDLIAPIESLLSARDLVIVPYGPLHSLPFHALFDGHHHLVDKFSICYEPSASIFAYCHRERAQSTGPSLIVGIDDPGMPFIREEVEAVAKVVPEPKVLWGAEASERALREYGANSKLIHIASHGSFRRDSPMFSSIRLADSYLSLYDLYRTNLPAELLTLSACVTGLDFVDEGDELIGLTRGLLYAGARSVLVSLWDVDDRSTADLFQKFYRELAKQSRKADAFRTAMIQLRERYAHPYYWAPFKLVGRAFM
jgi:CHAT domain-containing protein